MGYYILFLLGSFRLHCAGILAVDYHYSGLIWGGAEVVEYGIGALVWFWGLSELRFDC